MTPWPVRPLGSLAAPFKGAITDGPFGSNLTSAHYTEEGPLVVRLQNIGDGVFKHAPAHISPGHFASLRKHEVLPNDLLVASLGEILPRACLAPQDLGSAIVKADCIRIRLSAEVEPRWVTYALQRPEARRWADANLHGVGRPRLGLKLIREIPIPVPTLAEQRRIVDILEDHLSHLDAAADYLEAARRRSQRMVSAALDTLWYESAREGCWTHVGDLGSIVTGSTPRGGSAAFVGETPFITPGDVGYGGKVTSWERTLSAAGAGAGRLLPAGVVLVVCIGASLGKVGWSAVRAATNQQLNAVVLSRVDAPARYVAALMSAPDFQRQMRENASSTTMPILNKSKFSRLSLPLASDEGSIRLYGRCEEAMEGAQTAGAAAADGVRRGAALRRALLAAAFSGRLTGRAPDMDLAEELVS